MKIIKFFLYLIVIVAVLGVLAMIVGGSHRSHRSSDWHSWVAAGGSDAVILDAGQKMKTVTICNKSYRRRSDGNAVTLTLGRGADSSTVSLAHRACATVRASVITVSTDAGDDVSVRGRYRLEGRSSRSFRGMPPMMGHGMYGKDRKYGKGDCMRSKMTSPSTQDQAEASADETLPEVMDDGAETAVDETADESEEAGEGAN